jgi:multicomponent Na+:H+ antiporter subunit G
MISVVLDVVGGLLLVVGLGLMTIALVGVLRMPGTYSKLHAQGLATGPGVCCVLASSIATENAATISYAMVGIVFTVLTAPVASHAIARAARRRGALPESR